MRNISKLATLSTFVVALGSASVAFGESTGQYIDDATITTKVKAALLADEQLKAMHISVLTDHGVVKLSGTVKTADDESEAIKTVNNVKGVQAVKDLMAVSGQQQSEEQ